MITKISGKINGIYNDSIVIENGGLFYQVFVANNVLQKIKDTKEAGDNLILHTIYYFEGNVGKGNLVPRLIGFLEEIDREFFEHFYRI